eukprot:7131014-Prymnesium_polylepis.1
MRRGHGVGHHPRHGGVWWPLQRGACLPRAAGRRLLPRWGVLPAAALRPAGRRAGGARAGGGHGHPHIAPGPAAAPHHHSQHCGETLAGGAGRGRCAAARRHDGTALADPDAAGGGAARDRPARAAGPPRVVVGGCRGARPPSAMACTTRWARSSSMPRSSARASGRRRRWVCSACE